MKEEKIVTYQTRFSLKEEHVLDAYAKLYCKLERKLFANLMAKKDLLTLKRSYIQTYQVTAGQFNVSPQKVMASILSSMISLLPMGKKRLLKPTWKTQLEDKLKRLP